MASIDERIAAGERKLDEQRKQLSELKAEKRRRERAEVREAARREREQKRRDAVTLWDTLHSRTVTMHGECMTAYAFVTDVLMPRLDSDAPDAGRDSCHDLRQGNDEQD